MQTLKEHDHIFIKSDGKLIRLANDEILYIECAGDYAKFVTADKRYLSHNTIKGLEKKMNPADFLKVHRSFIVNINKVMNIKDNELHVGAHKIPVSKAHRADLMKRINLV